MALGPRTSCSQSRYAALLASMHGARLYELRDLTALAEADADAVREFLDEQRGFQERLLTSLRADPETAVAAAPSAVARNSRAHLDLGLAVARAVPRLGAVQRRATSRPTTELPISAAPARDGRHVLDPWPFAARR